MSSFFADMKEKKNAFWVFIPMLLLYAASYFQRTAVPGMIFNDLNLELGLNGGQIAGLGASFICVYSLSQLFVGMLADKYCGLRVVTIGGILLSIGVLLFPLFENIWLLYLTRAIAGVGASALYLSLVKETDRLFGRKNYSIMIGVVFFVGYGGGLCGTLPFERACSIFPWRNVLVAVAILTIAIYLLFLYAKRNVPTPPVTEQKISLRPLIHIIKNPYTWLLLICGTINFVVYFIIQTVFGKKFLEDFAGMSSQSAALVIFALTFACMLTFLANGIVSRMVGNRRRPLIILSTGICLVNSLVMTAAIYWKLPSFVFIICYIFYAVASGFSAIFSMSLQELNSRDILTQSAGFINMFNYLSVAIGSVIVGVFLDCFIDYEVKVGTAISYPPLAYLSLFIIISVIAMMSFVASFKTPETKGHYCNLRLKK